MPIVASFNYYPPTPLAIVVGVLLGLAFLVLAGFSRRVLVGFPVTMFAWAMIARDVCYQGKGDMTIIMMMFFGGIQATATCRGHPTNSRIVATIQPNESTSNNNDCLTFDAAISYRANLQV